MSNTVLVFRDYGTQQGMDTISYSEEILRDPSQVYNATHTRAGIRLPYRNRSFISFSFGGKWIEDFNLIATVDGDRMTRDLSGNFDDLTTSYDVFDGQFYHGTHFRTVNLSFNLSTDGMDLKKLEEFRHWFAGGKTRELILSEHPNRGIMARVAEPPKIQMLPFEKEVEFTVGSYTYKTSTTNYKGEISLELTTDEPFWYSIVNIFGSIDDNGNYVNEWDGEDFFGLTEASQDKLKDVLKIVYEDGIPIYNMIASPMIFGNDIYAAEGGRIISLIATPFEGDNAEAAYLAMKAEKGPEGFYENGLPDDDTDEDTEHEIVFPLGVELDESGNPVLDENELEIPIYAKYYYGAVIENDEAPTYLAGVIDGAYMANTKENGLILKLNKRYSVYYAGTAPSPIKLTFTIPIIVDYNFSQHSGTGFITSIASTYNKIGSGADARPYNKIVLEGTDIKELRLTTPNFYTSYNNVIYLLSHLSVGASWEDVRAVVRDEIRHPTIRKYAIRLINVASYQSDTILENISNTLIGMFALLISNTNFTVELDSKTGDTVGTITYYDLELNEGNLVNSNNTFTIKENIGDMVNSNYLILDEKNYFDDTMLITAWDDSTEIGKTYSHSIYHDFPNDLTNFAIEYKNMYY